MVERGRAMAVPQVLETGRCSKHMLAMPSFGKQMGAGAEHGARHLSKSLGPWLVLAHVLGGGGDATTDLRWQDQAMSGKDLRLVFE